MGYAYKLKKQAERKSDIGIATQRQRTIDENEEIIQKLRPIENKIEKIQIEIGKIKNKIYGVK